MENTKTLPPLVRGNVTGVLNFFVDEIRINKVLFLSDNFDLNLQVQWWGEDLPSYIRPKKLVVSGRDISNNHSKSSAINFYCETYKIKTSLELFKSYLKACEVLELCILDAVKSCIIGSAFLRSLLSVLNKNSEHILLPVFDYLGEEIGEVMIHFNFLEETWQNTKKEQKEISHSLDQNFSKTKPDYFSTREKVIFYDGHSKKTNFEEVPANLPKNKCYTQDKTDYITFDKKTKAKTNNDSLCKNKLIKNLNEKSVDKTEVFSCKCFPEIQTSSDSSKVLYFGVGPQKAKTENKNPKSNPASKFNSNSIKCKTKVEKPKSVSSDHSVQLRKPIIKPSTSQSKNLQKAISVKEDESDVSCSETKSKLSSSSEKHFIQDIPSDDPPVNCKVLDYLLGSDLSKEHEDRALNDFKRMSPSHNLVTSINQLCLNPEKDSPCNEMSVPYNNSYLNFDFSNPIERDYYVTFFLKSNKSDFELAQYLNQPVDKFNEISEQSKNQFEKSSKGEETIEFDKIVTNKPKGCAHCKCYKKLDELDTVIDTLKQFERRGENH